MAHDWGIHTIATGRGLGRRGITRAGACTRARHRPDYALAIRGRGRGFRSVRLGGARGPGLLRVRTVGGRRRRAAVLSQTSGLGGTSRLGKTSRLRLGKTSGPIRSIRNRRPRGHTRMLRPPPVATRRHALRTHPALPRTNSRTIDVGDYRVHHGSHAAMVYVSQLDVLQVNVFLRSAVTAFRSRHNLICLVEFRRL